jgi:hypothetical protein
MSEVDNLNRFVVFVEANAIIFNAQTKFRRFNALKPVGVSLAGGDHSGQRMERRAVGCAKGRRARRSLKMN